MVTRKLPYRGDFTSLERSVPVKAGCQEELQNVHIRLLLTLKTNPYEGHRICRRIFETGT